MNTIKGLIKNKNKRIDTENLEKMLGIKLREKQRRFVNESGSFYDRSKILFDRGEGMSYACYFKALLKALKKENQNICLCLNSVAHCNLAYDSLMKMISDAKLDGKITRKGKLSRIIGFNNNSRIRFANGNNENEFRGHRYNHVIIDTSNLVRERTIEAAYISTLIIEDSTISLGVYNTEYLNRIR